MDFVPKLDWQDSPSTATPITASQLIRIENGIAEGARDSSETQRGNVELATAAEMTAGTDLARVPSVKRVADYVASVLSGLSYATTSYVLSAISSPFSLISSAISQVPLTIKGAVGQTADLLVFKDSDEVQLASIEKNGQFLSGTAYSGNAMFRGNCRSAGIVGVRIQGYPGQTANYYVAQDDTGQNKFTVAADGTVNGKNIGTPPGGSISYSPLLVLDADQLVPADTIAGTVILRRPA